MIRRPTFKAILTQVYEELTAGQQNPLKRTTSLTACLLSCILTYILTKFGIGLKQLGLSRDLTGACIGRWDFCVTVTFNIWKLN